MRQGYRELTNELRNRLDPENSYLEKALNEEFSNFSDVGDATRYVRAAMKGVDDAYTIRSKEAGEMVKTHLNNGGLKDAVYRYQGSVMTNTHIRGYSDIDLLVISDKFYTYDKSNVSKALNESYWNYDAGQLQKLRNEQNVMPYEGNLLDDLHTLRIDSEDILKTKYYKCDVDKPKSIKITNQNLHRDVDIVIANWYDDVRSILSDKGENRGIQVYNKVERARGKVDFPFLSIERINTRSGATQGRLKRMIRFLKNIKKDSSYNIELSSFDFNAICYDIDISRYQNANFYELVPVILLQLTQLATDINYANRLISVDGREYIFNGNPEKYRSLQLMMQEVQTVANDLKYSSLLI